jgi:hypothetical protein
MKRLRWFHWRKAILPRALWKSKLRRTSFSIGRGGAKKRPCCLVLGLSFRNKCYMVVHFNHTAGPWCVACPSDSQKCKWRVTDWTSHSDLFLPFSFFSIFLFWCPHLKVLFCYI